MQPTGDREGGGLGRTVRRYGPLGLILLALVVVGLAVAVGGGDDDTSTAATDEDDSSATGTTVGEDGAPPPVDRMPVTYAEAEADGTVDDYEWGERCDPDTGRERLPSVYALPCVPVFEGDNGGATSPGVTADTITIVRYRPDPSADMTSLIDTMGVNDSPEDQLATFEGYLELYGSLAETYGREFEVIDYQATGAAADEVASRSDATTIAEEYEPFAVIGGPALDRGAFAEELASRGIVCAACGLTSLPDAFVQQHVPYLWGTSPTAEQFLETLAAWVNQLEEGAEAAGHPEPANAVYAGDREMRQRERRVAVIHFEQDPPIFEGAATEEAGLFDDDYALRETYLFALPTMPDAAAELIAKMKSEEITTVLFLGDPIMPIYLTEEATNQDFRPEWIFTGTALTDTNLFGRMYDQEQMASAFGLSNVAAPTDQSLQGSWRLWKWYFGEDAEPPASGQYQVIAPTARYLVAGVQMAGPDLTPETYERGLFRIPPMGGGPTTPQVSFGTWGFFEDPDYLGIDDSVEIWWDPDTVGVDEIGREGQGVWRRARGAERFTGEDAPLPRPFVEEDTVTVFDALPDQDRPRDYPPPPGSPAAG